jgi:hypothetical protein
MKKRVPFVDRCGTSTDASQRRAQASLNADSLPLTSEGAGFETQPGSRAAEDEGFALATRLEETRDDATADLPRPRLEPLLSVWGVEVGRDADAVIADLGATAWSSH